MARKRAARKKARQEKAAERKSTRQSKRQERKTAKSDRKTSRQSSRQERKSEKSERKTTRQTERQERKSQKQTARQDRKSRKQSARQERKQTRVEQPKRWEGRQDIRMERVKQKGESGYWTPEAVESRAQTWQAGISTYGDVAGTALETTGEFLEALYAPASGIADAAGSWFEDVDLSGVSDLWGDDTYDDEDETGIAADSWYDDLPAWAIPAAVVGAVGLVYLATREPKTAAKGK